MDEQTIIAELDVASPNLVLGPTLARNLDVTVRAERLPVSHRDTTWFYVTVMATDFEQFDRAVDEDRTVSDSEVFASYGRRRTYRLTIAPTVPVMTNHVTSFGDELLDLRSTDRGWRVQIRTTDRSSIKEFWLFCDSHDIDVTLQRVFEAREPIGEVSVPIERNDFDVLRTAYREGYFQTPREISLAELADRFDVSESTMSVRLRRAVSHVVERVLPDSGELLE